MSPDTTVLTDPRTFFRERADDPSLKGPALVVTAIGVLTAFALVFQYRTFVQLFEGIEGASDTVIQVILAVTFLTTLVSPFIIWLLYAGAFHAISVVFDGDGEFSDTLALVGWGFVPSVLNALASVVLEFYRFEIRGVDVPSDLNPESMGEFTAQIQEGPVVALSALLAIAFTLWSAYLWVLAMEYARDLSTRNAVLTIALPVLVGIGFSLRQLLTAL